MTTTLSEQPRGFYEPLGDGMYRPTKHVQGAWRDTEQHMAPVAGLLTAALQMHDHREDMQTARISLEICGVIDLTDTHVETRTLRPGRTIELVEGEATIGDRVAIRGRSWRLAHNDTGEVAGHPYDAIPGHEECATVEPFLKSWPGGFIEQIDVRAHRDNKPGHGIVWVRSDNPLFTDGSAPALAEFLRLADCANGSVPRTSPKGWMFPNVDWTAHIFRQPVDTEWLGLEIRQSFSNDGAGLTSSVLHDVEGPLGKLEQILTVRPMPKS